MIENWQVKLTGKTIGGKEYLSQEIDIGFLKGMKRIPGTMASDLRTDKIWGGQDWPHSPNQVRLLIKPTKV